MSKKIIILFILFSIMLLSSCTSGSGGRMIFDDSDKKADAKIEQILEIVKSQDKEALKSLFSEQVLDEIKDFDERIDYLFGFIHGEIGSWKRIGGPVGDDTYDNGQITKEVCTWYNIDTNVDKYIILIRECTIDTINPANVGLYMLKAIKAEDIDVLFDSQVIGIYMSEGR